VTIRLLAIDIDGTLLDSRGRLPEAHRDAVVDAAARGVEIALVTGRSYHFARPIAELLPIALTLILNNGAVAKDAAGRTVLRHLLPRTTARRILEETAAYGDCVAIVFDRPDARQIVFDGMDWSHPHRRGYYERNRPFIASAEGPLADALSEDPIQVMFNGGVVRMRALADALRALPIATAFSVALTEYASRDFSLVDVNRAGCSKGATLAEWAAARGIAREAVMAIGDNFNDADMLAFAGVSVVMGNASDALKRQGYGVTATNDEGGLADAIRRHITDC
jgi:Cof subfamily protein (haloacid dehalogenase superfamily)